MLTHKSLRRRILFYGAFYEFRDDACAFKGLAGIIEHSAGNSQFVRILLFLCFTPGRFFFLQTLLLLQRF